MIIESQNKTVHAHLIKYGEITPNQAIRLYPITRLGARIYDLKERGIRIASELQHDEFNPARHWANYKLIR